MTRSDKRGTKCPFSHSEILKPTESAIKGLQFDVAFKTAERRREFVMASSIVVAVEWLL